MKNLQYYNKLCLRSFLLAVFFLLVIDCAVIFFAHQMHRASQKPFWGDEIYGLETSVRHTGYGQLVLKGAGGQGSPSPLDYIALKGLDQIKETVSYFGLNDEVYFRLFANFITAFSAVFIVYIFLMDIIKGTQQAWVKLLQALLLLGVPVSFYYTRMVHYYAAESRPYALWNSLWFVVLAGFLSDRKNNKVFIVSLYLLALSATASMFQIFSLALAYILVYFDRSTVKGLLSETGRIFLPPLVLAFYYALYSGQWGYPSIEDEWRQFVDLWAHESILVVFMLVAAGLAYFKKENRRFAVVPIASILLFLIAPAIFFITKHKGFFFTDRQYIYFELTNAVFLLVVIKCLPSYLKQTKGVVLSTLVFCIISFIGYNVSVRPKIKRKFFEAAKDAARLYYDPAPVKRLNHVNRW